MSWITIVQLIIGMGQGVLAGMQNTGAPQEILAALQNGIQSFQQVHGTLVTKAQIDANTLEFKW